MIDRPEDRSTLLPRRWQTPEGKMRRVGVEIELGELPLDQVASAVVDVFGGSVRRETDYELVVATDDGDFRVEIDSAPLKSVGRTREEEGEVELGDRVKERVLGAIAGWLTPCEIVSPPLPMDRLGDVDRLAARLVRGGASGTGHAPWFAYGVHFNPEAPEFDAETLLAYLQAYCLLYPRLVERGKMDLARRITPYADAYPADYVEHILAPGYDPDLSTLIDDYLEYNPTRDRGLDMLPMFLQLDESRVRSVVQDERVKARPTFHYRLPNSSLGEPGWSVTQEWRRWLEVERLADDPPARGWLAKRYRTVYATALDRWLGSWLEDLNRWDLDALEGGERQEEAREAEEGG